MIAEEANATVVMGEVADGPGPELAKQESSPSRRRGGRLQRFVRVGTGVWVGLFIVAAGFGLIAFTWAKVAALVDVALQLPYLVSGGLGGLGLILLGLLVTNLSIRRRESLERARQLDEVREALVRLKNAVQGGDE